MLNIHLTNKLIKYIILLLLIYMKTNMEKHLEEIKTRIGIMRRRSIDISDLLETVILSEAELAWKSAILETLEEQLKVEKEI